MCLFSRFPNNYLISRKLEGLSKLAGTTKKAQKIYSTAADHRLGLINVRALADGAICLGNSVPFAAAFI